MEELIRVVFLNALRVEKLSGENWRLLEPLTYLLARNAAHRAAVVHDWLYAIRAERSYADDVFAAAIIAAAVFAMLPPLRARVAERLPGRA